MKKKLLVIGLVSIMTMSMVACGSDEKTGGSETTSAISTVGSGGEASKGEDDTEKKSDVTDELTDEYLLSQPETVSSDFMYHEMEDGNISIDRYIGVSNKEVIIVVPAEIDGKKVTKIAKKAFNMIKAKAIVLGVNINEISGESLEQMTIEKLLIPGPVKKINENTFTVSKIQAITLPNTLEEIASGAFSSCNIEEIKFPSSVKTIGHAAFMYSQLQRVYFEGGAVEIGPMAFSGCSNLKEVHIPDCDVQFRKLVFESTENVTIFTPAGSAAEAYAKENGIKVENE